MTDVFISYARADQRFARALVEVLETKGWEVFWDRDLIPGQTFEKEIQRQLDAARCVIVLWSRVSKESSWVKDEAVEGRERGCLISVAIEDVLPPLGFRQGQVARLDHWDQDPDDRALVPLLKGVRALVGGQSKRQGQPAPATPTVRPSARPAPTPAPRKTGQPMAPPAQKPAPPPRASRGGRAAPTILLVVIFLANIVQTTLDSLMTPEALGRAADYPLVQGFRWFEGNLSFASHDATSVISVVGYSVSYFFLFPALAVGVGIALARRKDPLPYQSLALAIGIVYLVSLPFFVAMPIPERWAFPEANAILLSDLWTTSLIEAFRPMSGLDNCFPSFHTSLSVLLAVTAYTFGLRFRFAILMISCTIVLSTIALGIHWVPDLVSGALLGGFSVLLARRLITAGAVTWLGLGAGIGQAPR